MDLAKCCAQMFASLLVEEPARGNTYTLKRPQHELFDNPEIMFLYTTYRMLVLLP